MPIQRDEMQAVRRAGLKLAQLREIHHLTQRDVQKKTRGAVIAQQLSRLETGSVERPSMHDLCRLATLYNITPNDMGELYDYWHPTKDQLQGAPEDPRIRNAKQVARSLSDRLREKLLNAIEIATVLVENEAAQDNPLFLRLNNESEEA